MKTLKLIKLFIIVKADMNDFTIQMPKNYPHVFSSMMTIFNGYSDYDKENLSILYQLNDELNKLKTSRLSINNKVARNIYIKRAFSNSLNNRNFKVGNTFEDEDYFEIKVNPLLVEETLESNTQTDIESIKDVIDFFDQVDYTLNDSEKIVKRK